MAPRSRHQGHDKYKTRIDSLLSSYLDEDEDSSPESQSNNAKYLAVLMSGYLEQAIKELLLDYASKGARQQISMYIENTWPKSMNMNDKNIKIILNKFNAAWGEAFSAWLGEKDNRKSDINDIVSWRNRIAHGQESNTNGVTLFSVKDKFLTVKLLVTFLEEDLLTS